MLRESSSMRGQSLIPPRQQARPRRASLTMTTQIELPLSSKAPRITPQEVERVCTWLQGRGWVTAAELREQLGLNDRQMRVVVEHAGYRILSGPGHAGYRYFDAEALPEVDAICNAMSSQIRKMTARVAGYRSRYHHYARDVRATA